ncbi:MAG: SAM-dependent methyltransferase [Rikenellaceae bacterium]
MKGALYLIPSPLGNNDPKEVIPVAVMEQVSSLKHFVVEEVRTARRYLSKIGLKGKIDTLEFYELNEHTKREEVEEYVKIIVAGESVGLISEAGLPAIADPGSLLVELAHNNGIEVRPMAGPSSLMMALMASGMNGQCFAFTGYLPVKQDERRAKIRQLEKISISQHQTQIIIETPYRNNSLFADFLQTCSPKTRLCIAAEISLPDAFIKTKTIEQWGREKIDLNKKPCVFIL